MGGACKKKSVRCGPSDILVNFFVPEFGGISTLESFTLGGVTGTAALAS